MVTIRIINFIHNKISIDFSKSEYGSIKYALKEICVIPCFYHFIHNIIKKIPNLRSKNKKENQYLEIY